MFRRQKKLTTFKSLSFKQIIPTLRNTFYIETPHVHISMYTYVFMSVYMYSWKKNSLNSTYLNYE